MPGRRRSDWAGSSADGSILLAVPSDGGALRAVPREALVVTPGGIGQRGGMGSVVRTLVEAWPTAGAPLAVRVVDPWPHEWKLGIAPRSLLAFMQALLIVLRAGTTRRLALVHVHMAGGGSVVRKGVFVWLGWMLGARVIVHSAAADIDQLWQRLPTAARRLLRLTLGRADAVVTLGIYWRRFFTDEIGLAAERVLVIPNGVVDPGSPLEPSARARCRFLFAGRLGQRKGTPDLLDALADPRLADLDWALTLAGDGDVEAMQLRAAQLGIASRCRFTGWLAADRVADEMRQADVLVLPSHQEGLPMAILEGMSHGLAIISTEAGSIADAVTDGVNGRLVPSGDPVALAGALEELITDVPRRQALQTAARRRFEQDYSAEIFASRFAALYRRLAPQAGDERRQHHPAAEACLPRSCPPR